MALLQQSAALVLLIPMALGASTNQVPDGNVQVAAVTVPDDPVHDKAYWSKVAAARYALPNGEDAFELLKDLFLNLGSPDSVLRDDYGYGITDHWVRRQKLLSAEDSLVLIEKLVRNLEEGLGEVGKDSVLLRSFSALNLSIFAMADLQDPYLQQENFDQLLASALTYLEKEKDLRGRHPDQGWLHSAAHTADLLKFLGRSPRLNSEQAQSILEALARKLTTAGEIFIYGEDERMAAAAHAVILNPCFELGGLNSAIAVLANGKRRRQNSPAFNVDQYVARRNGVQFLRALYVRLALAQAVEGSGVKARSALLKTLATY